MNAFEQVKSMVSVKNVAEHYGLKINRNGMACCPFHKDRHPSMKVDDRHYHCFGCGAHGDAISYVASLYGIGQLDALRKINEDFGLGIDLGQKISDAELAEKQRKSAEKNRMRGMQEKLNGWRKAQVNQLLGCARMIKDAEEKLLRTDSHAAFLTGGFAYLMHVKPVIDYWLDVLCLGTEEEVREFFLADGKEVERIAANVKRAGNGILGNGGSVAG